MIGITGNYYDGELVEMDVSFKITSRSLKKMSLNESHSRIIQNFIKDGTMDSDIWDNEYISCSFTINTNLDHIDHVLEYWMDYIHIRLFRLLEKDDNPVMLEFIDEIFNNNDNYPLFPLYMISRYSDDYNY